ALPCRAFYKPNFGGKSYGETAQASGNLFKGGRRDEKSPREKEKSKEATPSGSKRSAGTVSNSVDYWIKKGQYPPDTPENTELRREVANALAKQTGDKSKFTPDPIV
ncbi:hypothetical protein LCGC14_2741660, partial [marine sediment metagenome]